MEQNTKSSGKKEEKKAFNVGDDASKNSTSNTSFKAFSTIKASTLQDVVVHNFSLKFPLRPGTAMPFTTQGFISIKKIVPKGPNSIQYLFCFAEAFVRQTGKSLIVFPYFEKAEASPGQPYRLKSLMVNKCIGFVKKLQEENPNLLVAPPENWRPSTQEYAMGDAFAKAAPYPFENEVGRIDKSVHVKPDGFVNTGGEIEYFSPQTMDAYIRMPIVFVEAMKIFEANMASHIKAIKKIGDEMEKLEKVSDAQLAFWRGQKPNRLSGSVRGSATVRGVR